MARTDTLGNFCTDIADSIREKTGETGLILASEFDTKIKSIQGGGSAEDLTEELNTYDNELTTQETVIEDIVLALQDKTACGGETTIVQNRQTFSIDDFIQAGSTYSTDGYVMLCTSNRTTQFNGVYLKNIEDGTYYMTLTTDKKTAVDSAGNSGVWYTYRYEDDYFYVVNFAEKTFFKLSTNNTITQITTDGEMLEVIPAGATIKIVVNNTTQNIYVDDVLFGTLTNTNTIGIGSGHSTFDGSSFIAFTGLYKIVEIEVEEEQPTEYIQDGLIALFDARDALDENGHWNSQIGDDYFYQSYPSGGTKMVDLKTDTAIINDGTICMANTKDYLKQNYTIELVGKATSGDFLAFDKNQSPEICIGRFTPGLLCVLNKDVPTAYEKTYQNLQDRRITMSLNLYSVGVRGTASYNPRFFYSVNGNNWSSFGYNPDRSTGGVYLSNTSAYRSKVCTLLSYYDNQYPSTGEVNCIRVYNRLLTDEELQHNYNVDKFRYTLDDIDKFDPTGYVVFDKNTLFSNGGELISDGYYNDSGTWVSDANYDTWKIPIKPGITLYQQCHSLAYYYKNVEYNGTIVPLTVGSNQTIYGAPIEIKISNDQEYEYLYTCFTKIDLSNNRDIARIYYVADEEE